MYVIPRSAKNCAQKFPSHSKSNIFSIFENERHPNLKSKLDHKMGKAKKTRKFAATKRILNTTKDTRLKSVKSKLTASTKSNPPKDTELVREMFPSYFSLCTDGLVPK